MTWETLLAQGKRCLQEADIADAELDAWYLLEWVSGMNRAGYFLHKEEMATQAQETRYGELIAQRSRHVPLQHMTGIQEFMGMEFRVNPNVLIPRQDTEFLVEKTLPLVKGKKVLDLCTGSGCIGIALAKLGHPARVDAVDLSAEALRVAGENAERLQAEVHLGQSDMFQNVVGTYDIIVSNPPYIVSDVIDTLMPEVREHEPKMALDGGKDGLTFYRGIAREAQKYLNPQGMVWVEIGYDQGKEVSDLLREQGFVDVECYQDLCGLDRVVKGRMEEKHV